MAYEYEEDLDLLYIKNYDEDKKVFTNLVIGNMVIDIAKNGKILGIEIDCASKFFKLTPEQLKSLTIAKITVLKSINMLCLGIVIGIEPNIEKTFSFIVSPESKNVSMSVCS